MKMSNKNILRVNLLTINHKKLGKVFETFENKHLPSVRIAMFNRVPGAWRFDIFLWVGFWVFSTHFPRNIMMITS